MKVRKEHLTGVFMNRIVRWQ